MATFYDTHAHLDFPSLRDELPDIIKRAEEADISKIVTIGTDFESSRRSAQIADRHDRVFVVPGWHPSDALDAPNDIRQELRELAQHPKTVAIGETGLDYYRLPSSQKTGTKADDEVYVAKQKHLFRQHLEVAAELGLNCVIHQRGDAFADTMAIATPFLDQVQCVFHCFVGTVEQMREITEAGSLVSFTGIVTFKNAHDVRTALKETPMTSFMLETDSPFLAPTPHRGKRCEPAYVKLISEVVAETRGVTLDELSDATCHTAETFYRGLST